MVFLSAPCSTQRVKLPSSRQLHCRRGCSDWPRNKPNLECTRTCVVAEATDKPYDKVLISVGGGVHGLRNTYYRKHLEDASKTATDRSYIPQKTAEEQLHAMGFLGTSKDIGNIAIVGAGIAGLYAGLCIKEGLLAEMPNTKITYFEAASEEGGRVFSYHFSSSESEPDPTSKDKIDPKVYCEIGAMRLPGLVNGSDKRYLHPRLHGLLEYLERAKLAKELPADYAVTQIPYVLSNDNGRVFVNGKRNDEGDIMTKAEADRWTPRLGAAFLGFNGNIPNFDETADNMLSDVLQPYADELTAAAAKCPRQLQKAFMKMAQKLDDYSMSRYLKEKEGWSDDQIAYVETMTDQTNAFQRSFMEVLMDFYEFSGFIPKDDQKPGPTDPSQSPGASLPEHSSGLQLAAGRLDSWTTIEGGLQRIAAACKFLLEQYQDQTGKKPIEFNFETRVTELKVENEKVVLKGVKKAADKRGPAASSMTAGKVDGTDEKELGTFDVVLLALPPMAVRMMKTPDDWSPLKREGLRSMRYDPIRKIGLLFKTRWWEKLDKPIKGGQTVTDLPSRWIVYPSNDIGYEGQGALLCYSWSYDASAHLSLSFEDKVEQALKDLEAVHGDIVRKEFMQHAIPFEWSQSYAGGIAFFAPGQWKRYYTSMWQPESNNKVFFAGEHLSVHHAWIEGAIESAQQAVCQMYWCHAHEWRDIGIDEKLAKAESTVFSQASRMFSKDPLALRLFEDSATTPSST